VSSNAIKAAWATACVALLVWTVGAGIAGSVQTRHYHHAQEQVAVQTHFYRVIAGQDAVGVHVNDTLASDLRSTPKDKLPLFQGTSNQYGGITAEIGVNPFDNTCGVECGRLVPSVLQNVERARDGHPPTIRAAKHVTSWLLPFALFVAVVIGGILLGFAGTLTKWQRRRSAQQSLRAAYPEECRTLDRLQHQMDLLSVHHMTPREQARYAQLAEMHDGIEAALKMRIDPDSVDDQISEARADKLLTEASQVLAAVEAGNEIGGYE
jgi:hypothetical protein